MTADATPGNVPLSDQLGPLPEPYTRQWINAPFSERLLFTEDQMRAYAAAERERAVLAFADFLHRLPDEKGRSVGPAMLLFDSGMLTSALWATSADTERWARMFLGPNAEVTGLGRNRRNDER